MTGPVKVEGDLSEANAAEFDRRLRALDVDLSRAVTLDLSGLDIEDGVALTTALNSIRELRARAARVVIVGAPQMLGHNLYRARMLEGPRQIELVDMRLDEPI